MQLRLFIVPATVIACTFGATAQEKETVLFEGLDMRLVKRVDSMTDRPSCTLRIKGDLVLAARFFWDLALFGDQDVFVQPDDYSDFLLAPDDEHLIRIGTGQAVPLVKVRNRNALTLADRSQASEVIKALMTEGVVRVRFYSFPEHRVVEASLKNPAIPFVYGLAVKQCGWNDVGIAGELPPAKLEVNEGQDGWARAAIHGNRELSLNRQGNGECNVIVQNKAVFGVQQGQWLGGEIGNATLRVESDIPVTVRQASGEIVLSARTPRRGRRWPVAQDLARAAWGAAPFGTIELGERGREAPNKVMLYGFRELWNWGVQNCQLPAFSEAKR